MSAKPRNALKESALFLKNAVLKPKQISYVIPSSRALIHSIAKRSGLDKAQKVIELGPGTGGTTEGFLKEMSQQAQLCAIEINKDFVKYLKKTIHDKRFIVKHDGAQNLPDVLNKLNWDNADVIISGIPFSTLPKGMGKDIMQIIYKSLKPQGLFIAYQFRDRVSKLATPVFGHTTSHLELKNFPPMRIYVWQK